MSTFTLGLFSGVPLAAYLSSLDPTTLHALFGILFGVACALAAIYLYVLINQPVQQPQPALRPVRRQRRIATSVHGFQPAAVFA